VHQHEFGGCPTLTPANEALHPAAPRVHDADSGLQGEALRVSARTLGLKRAASEIDKVSLCRLYA